MMTERLENLTWKEIRTAAEKGATAVLPLGSMEQHGPHLPVVTDTRLVESVSVAALSEMAPDVAGAFVLAPTLWLGASNHHQAFFALSLGENTYIEVLVEMIRSFRLAGFQRLFVLNGHGGNSAPLRVALSIIRQERASMLVGVAEYWSLAAAALRRQRKSQSGGAAHAGEIETSLMLHLSADLVRTADVGASIPQMPEGFEIDLVESGAVSLSLSWEAVSETGQVGDGTVAAAESGERFFGEITKAVAKTLRVFHGLSAAAADPT